MSALSDRTVRADRLRRRVLSPWALKGFFLAKLPLAWVAGLRIRRLDAARCEVTVPYGWRTQNPFRSIYFAAQSMAAELSTGAPAMIAVEGAEHSIAMLIVGLEASFDKKASAITTFVCEEVERLTAAVEEAGRTGEPVEVEVRTTGVLPDGEVVSRFVFRWSFKRRSDG